MTDHSVLTLDRPILHFKGEHDEVKYQATCIPAGTPDGDWSLKHFQHSEDAERHPERAERLGRMLHDLGVTDAYAPAVDKMSALITHRKELSEVIELPYGVRLYRNKNVPADGVPLRKGQAFVMSGGGCPVIVAAGGKDTCVVAHASRDSLLDPNRIQKIGEPRKYASVIQAIIGWVERNDGLRPGRLSLRGLFTIPAAEFTHPPDDPIWGWVNERRAEIIQEKWNRPIITGLDLALSIPELIKAQAADHGFGPTGVDKELPSSGPYGYTRHIEKGMRSARNLVVVRRTK